MNNSEALKSWKATENEMNEDYRKMLLASIRTAKEKDAKQGRYEASLAKFMETHRLSWSDINILDKAIDDMLNDVQGDIDAISGKLMMDPYTAENVFLDYADLKKDQDGYEKLGPMIYEHRCEIAREKQYSNGLFDQMPDSVRGNIDLLHKKINTLHEENMHLKTIVEALAKNLSLFMKSSTKYEPPTPAELRF